MQDLISIVIPTYNVAPYIERCLRGVANQTYRNLEIIIVNDGSTDETGAIIDRIAKADDRMIVIHKDNTGVSDTRNKGLDVASGDYIGFVDGDDEVYPDMFEFLISNAKKHHAEISHCGFELVNPDRIIAINGTGKVAVHGSSEALVALLQGKLFEPSTCNKLYARNILKDVRYPGGIRINEDLLFNVEAFDRCKRSVYEDVVKYRYMYNPNSAARLGFDISKQQDVLTVAKRIKNYLASKPALTREVDCFYAEKILSLYRILYANDSLDNQLALELRAGLSAIKGVNRSLRFRVLRTLIINFPSLYNLVRSVYNRLFVLRQKWKVPKNE